MKQISVMYAIVLFCLPAGLLGAPLPGQQGPVLLGPHMTVFQDTENLTIRQVIQPAVQKRFARADHAVPNYGFSTSSYWVRFELENPSPAPQRLMLELAQPHIDDVRLYIPEAGGFREMVSGRLYPFWRRPIAHQHFVFPVSVPSYFRGALYLRVEHEGTLQIPLYLWDQDQFVSKDRQREFLLGGYYGLILVMLGYNLFLWLSMRERAYLYYVLAILLTHGLAVFHINGYSYVYFLPDFPVVAKRSYPLILNLASFFTLLFVRELLLLREKTPLFSRVLDYAGKGGLGLALASIVGPYFLMYRITVWYCLIVAVLVLVAGFVGVLRRDRIALYYLAAWGTLIFFVCLLIFRTAGYVPVSFFTEYGLQIGGSIEVTMLSLALAERFRTLRAEKDRAVRMLTETGMREQRAHKIRELTSRIASTLDHQELVTFLRQGLGSAVAVDKVCMCLRTGDGMQQFHAQEDSPKLPETWVQSSLAASEPSHIDADGAHWLGIPISVRDNAAALLVLGRQTRFAAEETEILRTIAAETGMALNNIELFLEMHRLATIDGLTGIFTRHHFMEVAQLELMRAKRYKRRMTAIMVDIDNFKPVNDRYGHAAGDEVLRTIAAICRKSLREVDVIGRYGGDEFFVLLPETDLKGGREVAERIRKSVEDQRIAFTGQGDVQVSVSLGVAAFQNTMGLPELLGAADSALLEGKRAGKNRVFTAS
jgi:diguanylate cyclase (GGDEF)-like protein